MTFLIIATDLGKVKIKLLENHFTKKYIAFLKVMFDKFEKEFRSGPSLGHTRPRDQKYITEQTRRLIDCIDELNAKGYNFPYTVRLDSFDNCDLDGQLLLNNLHRSFTTGQRDHYKSPPKFIWNDRFESEFTVNLEDLDRMLYLTETINDAVHNIEHFMFTPYKTTDFNQVVQQLEIKSLVTNEIAAIHTDKGPYETLSGWFQNYTQEDYELFSDSDEYDVWVGRDILGKDFIHAFYDYDDPTNWDVTGQLGYSGKIAIDVGTTKKCDIIKSYNFKEWLDNYNIPYSKKMGGMPLGTVIQGKDLLKKFYGSMSTTNIKVSFE
jgi:hypothetical protein